MEFLAMHYWGQDIDDDDQDQDMKLPFKKISTPSFFQFALPATKPTVNKDIAYQIIRSEPAYQDFSLSDPALDCLFRPPRA